MNDAATPAGKSGSPSSLCELIVKHEIEAGTMVVSRRWSWIRLPVIAALGQLVLFATAAWLPADPAAPAFWLAPAACILVVLLGVLWMDYDDQRAGWRYLAERQARDATRR